MSKDPLLNSTNTTITSVSGDEYRKNREKSYNSYLNNDRTLTQSLGIFKIVFLIILMVNLMMVLRGRDVIFTFTGFLDALTQAPTIPTDWLGTFVVPTWLSKIPFIGSLAELLVNVISVASWGAVGISQIILYISYIAGYLFF